MHKKGLLLMEKDTRSQDTIVDFITGHTRPNAGAEGNRQKVERFLVEDRGYDRNDVAVDQEIKLSIDGEPYQSTVDLVVQVNGFNIMAIKCAAGSLASREREVIAAARLLYEYQIPLSVASDGDSALVWDTVSGEKLGQGLEAIPSKKIALKNFNPENSIRLDAKRRTLQKRIFRTYATRSCGEET